MFDLIKIFLNENTTRQTEIQIVPTFSLATNILKKCSLTSTSNICYFPKLLTIHLHKYLIDKSVQFTKQTFFDKDGNVTESNFYPYFSLRYINKSYQLTKYYSIIVRNEKEVDKAIIKFLEKVLIKSRSELYYFNSRIKKYIRKNFDTLDVSQVTESLFNFFDCNGRCSVMFYGVTDEIFDKIAYDFYKKLFEKKFCYMNEVSLIERHENEQQEYNNISSLCNFSSVETPIILKLVNFFEYVTVVCNQVETNNATELISKKSLNELYDKLTDIIGIVAFTLCSVSNQELDYFIKAKELENNEKYQSMYRKGRFDIKVSMINGQLVVTTL